MQSSQHRTALRRRLVPAVALGLAGLALAACGTVQAGAAATVGDNRITEAQLSSEVEQSMQAQGKPAGAADSALIAQTLTSMVRSELVDTLAKRAGIAVSQGMVDQSLASVASQQGMSVEVFLTSLAQRGYSRDQVYDLVRVNIAASQIGQQLDPTGSADTQGQAMMTALAALSDELHVTASPRYGAWDPASLSVGPAVDDVATLPVAE